MSQTVLYNLHYSPQRDTMSSCEGSMLQHCQRAKAWSLAHETFSPSHRGKVTEGKWERKCGSRGVFLSTFTALTAVFIRSQIGTGSTSVSVGPTRAITAVASFYAAQLNGTICWRASRGFLTVESCAANIIWLY